MTHVTRPDPLADLLKLGDLRLHESAGPVTDPLAPDVARSIERLKSALAAFRARHGFGRAIAAPQLGIGLRIVVHDLGSGPHTLINPRLTGQSPLTFTLWDDCMSFPDLLVRVRRSASISLEWEDETGRTRTWKDLARADAELFQHELDHLDGILAIDRALDDDAVVPRALFDWQRERYLALVDGVGMD